MRSMPAGASGTSIATGAGVDAHAGVVENETRVRRVKAAFVSFAFLMAGQDPPSGDRMGGIMVWWRAGLDPPWRVRIAGLSRGNLIAR